MTLIMRAQDGPLWVAYDNTIVTARIQYVRGLYEVTLSAGDAAPLWFSRFSKASDYVDEYLEAINLIAGAIQEPRKYAS